MPDRPLSDQIPIRRADEVTAIHAYEHAAELQTRGHRLDLTHAPARRRRFDGGVPPRPEGTGDRRAVTHAFHAPTGTAFKLGFGFAAGVAAFRAIVLGMVGLAVLVASAQIVHRLFG